MNSVKVQPSSLLQEWGEVWGRGLLGAGGEGGEQNTAPCWRKQITVGAILDFCWVRWRHRWALGKGKDTHRDIFKKRKEKEMNNTFEYRTKNNNTLPYVQQW